MNKSLFSSLLLALPLLSMALVTGCSRVPFEVTQVTRERLLVDQHWDARPVQEGITLLAPYKQHVDSMMEPVVGRAARFMKAHRPESTLSNLLADILVWGAAQRGEKVDFAVYNMGGIRAALAEGEVTYGDVLDVAPFENKLCILSLSGEKTLELFRQIAAVGGEGLSHGVQMRIGEGGNLLQASLFGQPVDPQRTYRVATLDYLAQGNDHLEAFKAKTQVVQTAGDESNIRSIICKYFAAQNALGKAVDAKVEGRCVKQ